MDQILKHGKSELLLKLNITILPFVFLAFVSIIVYLCAPDTYRFEYDCYCGIQYVVSVFIFLKLKKKKNYFDFDTIFLIAFFCTFFIYPIFLYPINPRYFAMFNYGFDENVISKCTALALVGSQMYILGSMLFTYSKKGKEEQKYIVEFLPDKGIILMTISFFVLFLVLGGYTYYKNLYGGGDASVQFKTNAAFSYANILFQVFLVISIMLEFNKQLYNDTKKISMKLFNKIFFIFICLYIPFLLSTGTRGTTMETLLMIIGLYTLYYRPIKFKSFLILVLIGALGMSFIAVARGKGSFEIKGFVDIFMDLIINNRNTFVAVDYADQNGVSYGLSMLGYILKVIPFAQNVVFSLFGIEPYLTNSALFLTVQTLGHNPTFGLGTNIIADLYLAFGFGGVMVCMFFAGYIVAKAQYMALRYHVYYMLLYTIFMSYAVYNIRAEFFFSLNMIVWAFCVLNILRSIVRRVCCRLNNDITQ